MKIFECLIEKIDGCKINPENQFKTKVSEHILSDFLRSTISSFESIENQQDVYGDKDCMKKFCESLRDNVIKINNFEKKKMKLFTKQLQESYENAKICYIRKEKINV